MMMKKPFQLVSWLFILCCSSKEVSAWLVNSPRLSSSSSFSSSQQHDNLRNSRPRLLLSRRPTQLAAATATTDDDADTDDTHWMDFLKFEGKKPSFDVIAKTKEYTSLPGYRSFRLKDIPNDYYDDSNYLFRGPIVGPINRQDLVQTNTQFNLDKSFPDLDRQTFGFTVDPDNPFRVLYFERWVATHTGDLTLDVPFLGSITAPATHQKSISPAFPFSIVWTPDGKVIYEHLSTAVDRFEGKNTMGKVAVFGLLETAGISLDNNIGNSILILQQKLNRFFNSPAQVYSKDEDIPTWWKSRARGAEPNDM